MHLDRARLLKKLTLAEYAMIAAVAFALVMTF